MKQEVKAIGTFATLGIEIVLCLLVGFLGGRWLDGRFETAPVLAIVGFLFGCGAAVKGILRTLGEMKKVTAQEEREEGNPAPAFEDPRATAPPSPEENPPNDAA